MRLRKVEIKNFKAIDRAELELADFNVIVGSNGSGKSSVLQALHWMFQSGRNTGIKANRDNKVGSTLSEKEATFMPSPDYRNAAHGTEYGNQEKKPQLDVEVEAEQDDGTIIAAPMWIKSARNEGLSVHVPSGNPFVAVLRDSKREYSAYIPGLAGIPLNEEKRSKSIVQKLAAAGDANTVLRNILLLLKEQGDRENGDLNLVQQFVSRVMGKVTLQVEFDEDRDTYTHPTELT